MSLSPPQVPGEAAVWDSLHPEVEAPNTPPSPPSGAHTGACPGAAHKDAVRGHVKHRLAHAHVPSLCSQAGSRSAALPLGALALLTRGRLQETPSCRVPAPVLGAQTWRSWSLLAPQALWPPTPQGPCTVQTLPEAHPPLCCADIVLSPQRRWAGGRGWARGKRPSWAWGRGALEGRPLQGHPPRSLALGEARGWGPILLRGNRRTTSAHSPARSHPGGLGPGPLAPPVGWGWRPMVPGHPSWRGAAVFLPPPSPSPVEIDPMGRGSAQCWGQRAFVGKVG